MTTIEIDGKQIQAESGAMVIEAADAAGIQIPRFCYHKKLSVAANCRMCLVEVEKSRKPLPACATPVTDGMKIFTKSPLAIAAQKSVMEFLLINHPLDCPICDQGGECELQDVSMGYGNDISRYTEGKRSVADENLGALISTEMTRCIHCTRCVRFGDEVAGIRELGTTNRGENRRIGTYVESSMKSEVSGNIIDLCPVGALTNKPFRYSARTWELQQHETVSPHDCLGSNMYLHTRRNTVMRAVPHENEQINETWITDRDRFACHGLLSDDRLAQPKIKVKGKWQDTDWETALNRVVKSLREQEPEQIGAVCHPNSTVEEAYLLQKLIRQLGSNNIDHRVTQTDFTDQHHLGLYPELGLAVEDIIKQDAVFLVGANIQREVPLIGLRIRKAALNGARVFALNPFACEYRFPVAKQIVTGKESILIHLAQIAKALTAGQGLNAETENLLKDINPSAEAEDIATALKQAQNGHIIIGALANNHPQAATIRSLVQLIAELAKVSSGVLSHGANGAGASIAGAIPHRAAAGVELKTAGLSAYDMFANARRAYVLLGLEPELDCANPVVVSKALNQADTVICLTAYTTPRMLEYADVLLPITPYSETSGTYVNTNGIWQSFTGAVKPFMEARPAWKVLRVLGNLFDFDDFDYTASTEIRDAVAALVEQTAEINTSWFAPANLDVHNITLQRITEWALYGGDPVVRRSMPLQHATSADLCAMRINPETANKLKLKAEQIVSVKQNGAVTTLPIELDPRIAADCIVIPAGFELTAGLGEAFGPITIER